MNKTHTLAIIGSGASAIFLLRHIVERSAAVQKLFQRILVFEKTSICGTGMPYSPLTTDIYNMSNISSEEIPSLPMTFVDWLRCQDSSLLGALGVGTTEIREDEVYTRLALGQYLRCQYHMLLSSLSTSGFDVKECAGVKIIDVRQETAGSILNLETDNGQLVSCEHLVIATGHYWTGEDRPHDGYFASPWPIAKILPAKGEFHNFPIGTLGASLSAFDVVASLAHRHGEFFLEEGQLKYVLDSEAPGFKIVMHSADGLLPQLQFEQEEPLREIYRHATRERILSLIDGDGFLRLETFFDEICRPVFLAAFEKDGLPDLVTALEDRKFGVRELVERMTSLHEYRDPFAGMRFELEEAENALRIGRITHWKEVLDDLMYTLNFHAHLLAAEDHLLLRSEVLPFVMNVIAAMPLKSARAMIALHEAGVLEMKSGKVEVVDERDTGETRLRVNGEGKSSMESYRLFVDCSGQKPLELEEFPFPGLVADGTVIEARAAFAKPREADEKTPDSRSEDLSEDEGGRCVLRLGGIEISEEYRVRGRDALPFPRISDIAFPHVTGLRPYSYGLQACNETAAIVVKSWIA